MHLIIFKTMKKTLNQLLDKKDFLLRMSEKLGIEKDTLENYFHTDRIPEKYKPMINEALQENLKADKVIKSIRVDIFERI